ncbi:hypothetical protein Taro_012614 [Colocasia esculenta]|uniref:Rho termination factor-like N-terminal domain-containing protein n=1 Tax=Colocasia esculenta TaxID=4460 RepID=A0A843UG59_COLES|nr:hypothetical protein [Colocasia esculenta]
MHAALLGLRLHGAGFLVASPRAPAGLLNLADIADVGLSPSSQRRQLQFSVCSIKSEGNRKGRSQRKSASDTPVEGDEKLKNSIPSVKESSELSSNEEILALFRRIQSSISKGEPVVRKKRNTRKVSQSPKRVSDAQRQDPKQKQVGDVISTRSRDKQPPQQRDTSSKDENIVNASASERFKPLRPPSKFVKQSPIPLALLPRGSTSQIVGEELPITAAEDTPGVQKIDGLKLSELKELAKSRGVKGYSKLKKGELLELLKRLPNLD